jgi:hypothetical protein
MEQRDTGQPGIAGVACFIRMTGNAALSRRTGTELASARRTVPLEKGVPRWLGQHG